MKLAEIVTQCRKMFYKVALSIFIINLFIILRLAYEQHTNYRCAIKSLEEGKNTVAISYFDRILNAYIPFSPIEEEVRRKLLEMGENFLRTGEFEIALLCFETVRSSLYLSRHFEIPNRRIILGLNNKIAEVKADLLVRDGVALDWHEAYNQQMEIMNKDFSPSVLWSTICVLSLFTYIGFAILWIFKGKKCYCAGFGLAFTLWILSLYLA